MTESKAEPSQLDKFKELARELECDEDEAKFEETVKKVSTSASTKPKGEQSD